MKIVEFLRPDCVIHDLTGKSGPAVLGELCRPLSQAQKVDPQRLLDTLLDREKLGRYSELYKRLGSYPYDQDPARPGWTPVIPNDRWADPKDDRPVEIPY